VIRSLPQIDESLHEDVLRDTLKALSDIDFSLSPPEMVGLDKIVPVVSNGADFPGTVVNRCSKEFQTIFNNADLIISKGQGNYETLSDCGKNIFFLLKVKCAIVAKNLGRKVGDFVVVAGSKI
jgi:uncharacterized protein with ATP-grasp and redox domains